MKIAHILAVTLVAGTMSLPAFAVVAAKPHNASTETQRDVNQQTRIENGLQSGDLNTREAAKLEHGEAHIDNMEARSMKDGELSAEEKARIEKAQDAESKAIYGQKHDEQQGNPDSKSSERMQADVQRNVNQETRINNGIENGNLTNKEAARLEHGQAHDDNMQARAGKDGFVGKREQRRIQSSENRRSRHIFGKKHNRRLRNNVEPATSGT